MQPRRYNRSRRQDIYDSNQECSIHTLYPHLIYHPKIQKDYSVDYVYRPDFFLGYEESTGRPVYIEAKEYFDIDMCVKYISICQHNTRMHLLLIVKNIMPKARERVLNSNTENLHLYETGMLLPTEWLLRCQNPHVK